jgi:uncharacterized LabA/DUF88 family protein
LAHQDRLNIAVFIDFDNIEIGVKNTLHEHFDAGVVLDAIKERGEVVTKIAYADWTRAGEYSRNLTQHAIRLVQRNLTPGGDKNGADINLALDALEMAFTHPHINAYVIVGGDSDFLSLVEKLKQYDKKVFVVGGRAFTSVILQRNCHEFIAYENLTRSRKQAVKGDRPAVVSAVSPVAQAFSIVRRALKILSDREVSPQTGLLKSTLLQLDSTFSERNYGASSFLDFAEKLAQAGLVQLKHNGRSVLVELNEGFEGADAGASAEQADLKVRTTSDRVAGDVPEVVQTVRSPESSGAAEGGDSRPVEEMAPRPAGPVEIAGTTADGVRIVGDALRKATGARWPMYLRNVKQILRATDGTHFDERRYGFGGLMDLLRACQRDGLLRLERDRRGGLRVFQGPALQQRGGAAQTPASDSAVMAVDTDAIEPGNALPPGERVERLGQHEQELPDNEPMPVDTTAELLGRARARKPRVKAAAEAGPRKAAPRKAAARRPARAKKAATEN